jgi:DNA-directed RNA polymerase specialized sigma subunit
MPPPAKKSIDIGLSVLVAVVQPGETMQQKDIAEICECSISMIQYIEKTAREKFYSYLNKWELNT